MRVTDETLLDRLLLTNKISLTEYHIASDLLRDLWKARFLSIPVPNFNSFGAHEPKDSSPAWSKAIEKLSAFFNRLDRDLGQNAKNVVTRILAHEMKPNISELETFRSSLVSYSLFSDEWRQR